MFRKPGDGTFLGRENVPDHPPDYVREDSPRHSHIRGNGGPEQNADRILSKLPPRLVRDHNGHTFALAGHAGLKPSMVTVGEVPKKPPTHSFWRVPPPKNSPFLSATTTRIANSVPRKTLEAKGWELIGPDLGQPMPRADIDSPCGDWTMRDQLQHELDAQAQTLKLGPYKTGRTLNLLGEGEGLVPEIADDREMVTRVRPRGASTLKVEKP